MNSKPRSGLAIVRNPRWVEAACWRRHQYGGDADAREALFETYLPFAKKLAADQYYRRRRNNYELGDLEQWAVEALLDAIDRYDPYRRIPFTAFARRRIIGNIADGIAGMSEVGRQSRHLTRLEKERLEALTNSGADKASDDPFAQLRELTIGLALGMMLEGTGLYLDADRPSPAPSAYDSLVWKNMVRRLNEEVENLSPPQPFLLRQHYREGVSFAQLAQLLRLSRGRISQLHRKALETLRRRLGKS